MAAEYAKRLGRYCDFEMREVRSEKALEQQVRAFKVVLDPAGRQMTSAEMAALVDRNEQRAVHEMALLIGGADGLGDRVRQNADLLLSLSRLTMPHELARVVLVEQIYRAFTTVRGHPYAR